MGETPNGRHYPHWETLAIGTLWCQPLNIKYCISTFETLNAKCQRSPEAVISGRSSTFRVNAFRDQLTTAAPAKTCQHCPFHTKWLPPTRTEIIQGTGAAELNTRQTNIYNFDSAAKHHQMGVFRYLGQKHQLKRNDLRNAYPPNSAQDGVRNLILRSDPITRLQQADRGRLCRSRSRSMAERIFSSGLLRPRSQISLLVLIDDVFR